MERNPPPSHTVRPVLKASLPALATSGRYRRRRRHQVRPLPEASLAKAKQKAQRMSSLGESGPDSAPSQSPLPPRLSTSQGGHRALLLPACLSTSHRLRQTQGPQDPASAPRPCLAPLPPLPTAQQDGLLSGFPHQTNPSPAFAKNTSGPSAKNTIPSTLHLPGHIFFRTHFRILLLLGQSAHPMPRRVRLSPDTLFSTLGPSAQCPIISSLLVHLTNSVSLYKLCKGRIISVLLATEPMAHSRCSVNTWWINVCKVGKLMETLNLLLQAREAKTPLRPEMTLDLERRYLGSGLSSPETLGSPFPPGK